MGMFGVIAGALLACMSLLDVIAGAQAEVPDLAPVGWRNAGNASAGPRRNLLDLLGEEDDCDAIPKSETHKRGPCRRQLPLTATEKVQLADRRRELLKRARTSKRLKVLEGQVTHLQRTSDVHAGAWNSTQLSIGAEAGTHRDDDRVRHKSQFNAHGAMKLAFADTLDKRLPSSKYVQVRACVVHAALVAQASSAAAKVKSPENKYLFIERDFDDAPIHITFGALAETIAPFAKYVVPNQWRDLLGKQFC